MAEQQRPVAVFQTEDSGALALAKTALEGAGIEYVVTRIGSAKALGWRQQFGAPPDLDVPAEIVVPAEDADKARDLLADLQSPGPAASESAASPPPPAADVSNQGPIELRETGNDALVGH